MVTSVLQDRQYLFDVRSLLMLKKMSLMRNDLATSFDDQCNDCNSHSLTGVVDWINV